MQFAIKDIVKGNKAHFSFYRSGNMFYTVTVDGTKWMFPVSLEDIGGLAIRRDEGNYTHALHTEGA